MRGSSWQRSGGRRLGRPAHALAAVTALLTLLAFSSSALASSAPTIESVSVAGITEHDATLEAQINPNGLETTYEFNLASPACQSEWPIVGPCFAISGFSLPSATIPAGFGDQTVRVDINSASKTLRPGTWYEYAVTASNAAGKVTGYNAGEGPGIGRNFAGGGGEQNFKTLSANAAPPSEVLTGSAEPTPSGYKLTGKLNPDGLPTTYYYEYIGSNEVQCLDIEPGLDRCWHETAHAGPITGDTQQEVPPIEVTGLTAGITYHYRLVATNADRTVFGNEASFTVGSPPVIESVSLSRLTSSDATLEAQIDTEGLGTTYAFHMWSSCAHEACEYLANIPLPSGSLLGSFVPQSVSLDLASVGVTLRYGAEYGWGITATSAAGHTSMSGGVFEPPPPSVIEPLSTTTSPLSSAGQSPGANTNSGDQPAGPGASSSPSTPGVQSPDVLGTKTTKLEPFEDTQKLAKALKLCEKKPKKQRASCEKRAKQKYASVAEKSKRT
jgi:hypothetical protein